MMTYGEKRKTCLFNLNNPDEREMYELVEKIGFSKLVKQFLAHEIQIRKQMSKQVASSASISLSRTFGQRLPDKGAKLCEENHAL